MKIKIQTSLGRIAGATRLLPLLLVLALAGQMPAQFGYVTNDGAITITGHTGSGGEVSIPGTINGLRVTSIGTSAFYGHTSLTRVTIPDSVTRIGDWAFEL